MRCTRRSTPDRASADGAQRDVPVELGRAAGGQRPALRTAGNACAVMSTLIDLVSPSVEFRDSYRGFVAEFAERDEKLIPFTLSFDSGDFAALVERLAACSRGIGLPDGFVAHSSYWLIRNRAEVVGVSNLRHALTPALRREGGHIGYSIRPSARGQRLGTEILRQTLLRAAGLGLHDVLVTCAKANAASARVILRNGGALQSEAFVPERGEIVQAYRIPIAANALR